MTSRIESGMLRVNMQVRRSRARDAIGDGARGSEERTRNEGIRRLLCMCRRVVGKEIGWVGCLFGNVYTGDWIGLALILTSALASPHQDSTQTKLLAGTTASGLQWCSRYTLTVMHDLFLATSTSSLSTFNSAQLIRLCKRQQRVKVDAFAWIGKRIC